MEVSRFCTYCGGQAVDDDRFCTHCGHDMLVESQRQEAHVEHAAAANLAAGAPAAVLPERETAFSTHAPVPESPPVRVGPPPRGPRQASAATTGRPPWLAAAVSGLLILIVVMSAAIVLITASGKPSPRAKSLTTQRAQLTNALLASRQLYASTQQPSYSALLPAGWHQIPTKLPSLTAATTVQSPVDERATITVGQIVRPAQTLRAEARQLLRPDASAAGFHQDANAATTLAGGRAAWVLAYDAGGLSAAYYLFRSCASTYAVSATVAPARASLLRSRIAIVAGTLQGNC